MCRPLNKPRSLGLSSKMGKLGQSPLLAGLLSYLMWKSQQWRIVRYFVKHHIYINESSCLIIHFYERA